MQTIIPAQFTFSSTYSWNNELYSSCVIAVVHNPQWCLDLPTEESWGVAKEKETNMKQEVNLQKESILRFRKNKNDRVLI